MTKTNAARPLLISAATLIAAAVLSLMVGSVFIPPKALYQIVSQPGADPASPSLSIYQTIFFSLRLPRTVLVALTGAALAASGASYQGLFRNPLADPYLIGIASGAGLGAVIAMSYRLPYTFLGLMAVPLAAFFGAIATVFIVFQLARVGNAVPTTNLLLAGVAISSFTGALTSFLMLSSNSDLHRSLSWLVGGATISGWQPVLAILPYLLLGGSLLFSTGHALNVLQFGDEQALQLGLPVQKIRLLVIVASSLTTAAAVSFAGIIGFLGLVVPHLVRLLWTHDYRQILPLSMLCGAALLLLADVIARVIMAPAEIPVGIITSLAGAPFFLWALRRTKQQNVW
jgi:iron complex transport system permease protein